MSCSSSTSSNCSSSSKDSLVRCYSMVSHICSWLALPVLKQESGLVSGS